MFVALSVANDGDETAVDEELSDVSVVEDQKRLRKATNRKDAPAVESLDRCAFASLVISFCDLDVVNENVNLQPAKPSAHATTERNPHARSCQ